MWLLVVHIIRVSIVAGTVWGVWIVRRPPPIISLKPGRWGRRGAIRILIVTISLPRSISVAPGWVSALPSLLLLSIPVLPMMVWRKGRVGVSIIMAVVPRMMALACGEVIGAGESKMLMSR